MLVFFIGSSDLLFLYLSICSNISSLPPQYVDGSRQRMCSCHLSILYILNTFGKITQVSSSCIELSCEIKTKTGNKAKADMLTGRKILSSYGHLLFNIWLKQRMRGLEFLFSYANDLLPRKGQINLWCYSHFWV